jgi:putative hydrolase of the HAD superfamily
MLEVLDDHEPDHGIGPGSFRPFLRDGFPWHTPDVAHLELCASETWWERVERVLARGYVGVGISEERATALARLAHERYVEVHRWRLFHDALPVLSELRKRGWRHVVLSNHVPELGAIISHLGLGELIEATVNSAQTGYEKPHPETFALARRAAGDPATIWMVGDNPTADVAGAEAAGRPAILVRRERTDAPEVRRRAPNLFEVEALLTAGQTERP